ncbi:MAG: hypothetical protein IKZ41_11310 [Clostridia bacterium]|nr:hypothetical protein [Clostridia bacterium]MBR5365212.1 hypothetical protein [Clostridia bacterium]
MEQIYTIPVNEAFEKVQEEDSHICPFCLMYNRLEANELDLILGASMMEPDVRLKTNELGFCDAHLGMMFGRPKRLPLALMLESHLDQIAKDLDGNMGMFIGKTGDAAAKRLDRLEHSCYICDRIEYNFSRMIETAALLWQSDSAFHDKVKKAPYFCLPHYGRFIRAAKGRLSKKDFAEFYETVHALETAYFDELRGDVSWFCKKFDYRYENEPWGNAKDAPERARLFLSGTLHVHEEELKKNDGGLT